MKELLLTPEEISRAAYQRNLLFGENDVLAYTRKPDADECIAKAQHAKDTGQESNQEDCPKCMGTGMVDSPHPYIKGNYRKLCPACDGTGKANQDQLRVEISRLHHDKFGCGTHKCPHWQKDCFNYDWIVQHGLCAEMLDQILDLLGKKDCWNCHINIDKAIEAVRKEERKRIFAEIERHEIPTVKDLHLIEIMMCREDWQALKG